MEIIVFVLMVTLPPSEEPKAVSYWLNQKHCLNDARLISSRAEGYMPVPAFCQPMLIDPESETVKGLMVEK